VDIINEGYQPAQGQVVYALLHSAGHAVAVSCKTNIPQSGSQTTKKMHVQKSYWIHI